MSGLFGAGSCLTRVLAQTRGASNFGGTRGSTLCMQHNTFKFGDFFLLKCGQNWNRPEHQPGSVSSSIPVPSTGGFTESEESDSYAGELGESELFHRVRRFPPGPAPPRRPGFMFPPPPAGPPPEPGDLYSVLQCKNIIPTQTGGQETKFQFKDIFKYNSTISVLGSFNFLANNSPTILSLYL